MTPEELAAIRERHHIKRDGWNRCRVDDQPWPCDTAKALAHIDAITEAVEDALHDHGEPAGDGCEHCETNIAVLALLRGTP